MDFCNIVKGTEAEGKEKHVPYIEIGTGKGEAGADIVHVMVGKDVAHPNTVEHHIAWLDVYGVRQNGQVITLGHSDFAPGYTSPNVRFQVPLADFKAFCALAYCNVHGLWGSCLEN